MKLVSLRSGVLVSVIGTTSVVSLGCSKKSDVEPNPAPVSPPPARSAPPQPSATAPATPETVPGSAEVAKGATGTLVANPNPVPLCDKTGMGQTTITWNFAGTNDAQIRLNGTEGGLMAATKKLSGSQLTGPWVQKGMTFYLQDVSDGAPLDPAHTIAKLTVDTVGGGPCK